MIEVESKIKISNPDAIRKKARLVGKYKGKQNKIDDYYTLESLEKYPRKSLRVRKLDGHYQINFKQWRPYIKGVHAKKETEFNVSDIQGFLDLIQDFGFKKWIRKEKETELYEVEKNLHIELNNVKGLGWFVEVECLSDSKHVDQSRNKVLEVFERLGLDSKETIKDGYTKLLWQKKN